MRDRERAAAVDDPGVEAEAAEHQRAHVDAVEQHHERGHARGDVARLHARLLRSAQAVSAMPPAPALREQPRRGVAGERDLGARAQADAACGRPRPRRRGTARCGRRTTAPRARARTRASTRRRGRSAARRPAGRRRRGRARPARPPGPRSPRPGAAPCERDATEGEGSPRRSDRR